MKSINPVDSKKQELLEQRKRRREVAKMLGLGLLFLVLTWIEFNLFESSRVLPFEHSIFFFGLVNFNIIVFLLLMFLIFRNIVKVFSEKQDGLAGSTLKGKLIAAFVGFSFVPTALMFLVSVIYINNSFDKWFNHKMVGVLKSSLEVTDAYHSLAKKKNYHFASLIAKELKGLNWQEQLKTLREKYSLDSVEYYPNLFGARHLVKESSIPELPAVSLEFRQKGISQQVESSLTHHFDDGNLVRVIVPVRSKVGGAIVVSSFIPLSIISKMKDIYAVFEDFRDVDSLEYPLKSIYLIILVLMTLVILLGATWFGFYLAKQLSIPLELLGKAAKRIAKGDYRTVDIKASSPEITQLVGNFNKMSEGLEKSQMEVRKANDNLRRTLTQLDEHSRYIEVVLSNVTTGVISVNQKNRVTMANRHACKLLQIDVKNMVGRDIKELLGEEYYSIFSDLSQQMKSYNASSIQKEIRVTIKGQPVPMQLNLSILYDEHNKELGKILVFDDLSMLVRAQRAAAWNEVAKRIAHEIKNPLTPIRLSAQRLRKKFGDEVKDQAFEDSISMIISQVDDLKNLVNEFSQFARLPRSQPVMSDLNKVCNEAVSLFSQAHKEVEFELSLDSQLEDFLFDPDQIKRVITNLVDNSIAANGGKGSICVATKYDKVLKIVKISVVDEGVGISEGMKSRVFEPYVTSKKHGTGLGLAIVKRMVEDHNGFIRAFANEPKGTKIIIELPVIVADTQSRLTNRTEQKDL